MKLLKSAAVFLFILVINYCMAIPISAYTISFDVFSEQEQKYIYDDIGSANSGGSRFCDGSSFIIYEFPVSTTDKYVSLNWTIANQYAVYVCTTDPDDMTEWIPIYFLERPADADKPDWSPFDPKNVTHDLSKYASLCKEGKIWIIMADSDPSGGWGGYISKSDPVIYKTSSTVAVVGAVLEYVPKITESEEAQQEEDNENIDNTAETDKTNSPLKAEKSYGIAGVAVTAGAFIVSYAVRRKMF